MTRCLQPLAARNPLIMFLRRFLDNAMRMGRFSWNSRTAMKLQNPISISYSKALFQFHRLLHYVATCWRHEESCICGRTCLWPTWTTPPSGGLGFKENPEPQTCRGLFNLKTVWGYVALQARTLRESIGKYSGH